MRFELLIILLSLAILGFIGYTRRKKSTHLKTTTPQKAGKQSTEPKSWLEKFIKNASDPNGKHQEIQKMWWFPASVALLSYITILIFSAILLPEKIWDFWSGTTLCWALLAIIPLFTLGMVRGGVAGKIGAIMLVIISMVSLINADGFNSTFGETEVERQAKIATEEVARQEEFLARQPKVVTLELPFGKWVQYQNKRHKLSYWETKGDGCVALAIDGGRTNLVCTYPEQEQTIIWPFREKMPKATTLLRIRKNLDLFQVMNLSNVPDTLVLTIDP